MVEENNSTVKLSEIALLFFKLGIIGFGGPAAHIAMMKQEVVERKKWMSEQHFLDLLGATNLIPGPNSTEMAIHIGYDKAGWKGLLIAGICFIFPAVFLTGILAILYQKYNQVPEIQPFIYGIKPAIIAIIIGAVYPLLKKSLKSNLLVFLAIIVFLGSLVGVSEIVLMFGAGLIAIAFHLTQKNTTTNSILPITIFSAHWFSEVNLKLFFSFLKIGAILYGSGYVLFAFLDTELVSKGLLTKQQLMDAIAIGQFTPGPVFSSVTFIGYQINGLSGALLSTLAIFLPSFAFVALLQPLMKKMRKSTLLSVFLDAVNVASIALIFSVCVSMAKESFTDWRMLVIAIMSGFIVFRFRKINSAFIVLGGAVLGWLFYFLSSY